MSLRVQRFSVVISAIIVVLSLMATTQGMAGKPGALPDSELTDLELLGKFLYFDKKLSQPDGQACADCHLPAAGFDDPNATMPVSQGVIQSRWGNRNSPAAGYAMYAPTFHFDWEEELWVGGQFWDGRGTGWELGDPLADQALGPPLNPLEMNNPNKGTVVSDVARGDYAPLFEQVWGEGSLDDVEAAYDRIAIAIAVYERSGDFARFDSRYDQYLMACVKAGGDPDDCANGTDPKAKRARRGILNDQEWTGLQLFMGDNDNDGVLTKSEGALCSACHIAEWIDPADYANPIHVPQWAKDLGIHRAPPVFSDFTFDNLGAPKNRENPFYTLPPSLNPDGWDWVDLGLGGALVAAGEDPVICEPEMGKFKVMTLRNIGVTAPYLHNGLFDTLAEVVNFYSTRNVADWPAPEYAETVNDEEMGNLGLSPADEAALVAFMLTLTDADLAYLHVEP